MSLSAREKLLIATPTGVQLDGSRAGGAKFMASVVLDYSTVDVVSSIHMHFVLLLKYWMANST
jgi:hypothetical protein